MADIENERTEILRIHITITISIYITRSLHVILVLLLHHVGVNYMHCQCVEFGVQSTKACTHTCFYRCNLSGIDIVRLL